MAQRLTQLGFEVYCPTQRIKKRWSDRWKWIEQPLFTSHLFIQIDPERRDAIYFVPGFVRFLFWLKRPALVRPQEIDTLKRWLNDFTPEAIQVESLLPGQHLKIQSGPFQGQEAQLLEHRGDSMVLYLPSIQLQVRVDLSHTEIQAV